MAKLAVAGHSLIHPRQQNFFLEVARALGDEVTLLSPMQWGGQKLASYHKTAGTGTMSVWARPIWETPHGTHTSVLDGFRLANFTEDIQNLHLGNEDWLYVQQEPESALAREVAFMPVKCKKALFTWENILEKATDALVIGAYDMVMCGNDAAAQRMAPYAKSTAILPQVGVDTDHFAARPLPREIQVAYVGRMAGEKGVKQLLDAWPNTRFLQWVEYSELPWYYSQAQVMVSFSQDTAQWREQAMPYVSCEAMACGGVAVVSDAGSIPYWHGGGFAPISPAVIVPQGSVETLREALVALTRKTGVRERLAREGREWVETYLSSRVIARKLVEVLL